MTKVHLPGEPAPCSGQYQEVDPESGRHSSTEITAISGKPLPPTRQAGHGWLLVDATRHKTPQDCE